MELYCGMHLSDVLLLLKIRLSFVCIYWILSFKKDLTTKKLEFQSSVQKWAVNKFSEQFDSKTKKI